MSNSFSPSGIIAERLHFVPHVIHQGLENSGTKARGVGFLFFAEVGVPTATVDVVVPISILFLNNVSDYRVVVDPLSFAPTDNPGSENLNRVFVRGSFPANFAEGSVRLRRLGNSISVFAGNHSGRVVRDRSAYCNQQRCRFASS